MEECPVLVVMEIVVYLLVPYNASSGRRDIDHLQPKGTPDEIIRKHRSTLQTRVDPSLRIRMGDIQSRDCYSVNFVRWLRDISFDCLLVGVTEDGWHDGSLLDDAGETKAER